MGIGKKKEKKLPEQYILFLSPEHLGILEFLHGPFPPNIALQMFAYI